MQLLLFNIHDDCLMFEQWGVGGCIISLFFILHASTACLKNLNYQKKKSNGIERSE